MHINSVVLKSINHESIDMYHVFFTIQLLLLLPYGTVTNQFKYIFHFGQITIPFSGIDICTLPVSSYDKHCNIFQYLTFSQCCRKKRKWDQPAESFVSAGVALSEVLPLGNIALGGIALPGVTPVSSALLMNPLVASCAAITQVFQASTIQQHTATIVPKVSQLRYLIWVCVDF